MRLIECGVLALVIAANVLVMSLHFRMRKMAIEERWLAASKFDEATAMFRQAEALILEYRDKLHAFMVRTEEPPTDVEN